MSTLPSVGLYVSTKKVEGMSFYIESAYGDDPSESYLVEVIDGASKDDPFAMGDEMIKQEWESLVNKYGLKFQE